MDTSVLPSPSFPPVSDVLAPATSYFFPEMARWGLVAAGIFAVGAIFKALRGR